MARYTDDLPTSDVVPRSEFDQVLENWQKIHDSYNVDCIEHYNRGRQDAAREIFEEIEACLAKSGALPETVGLVDFVKFAELKKKYTEGNYENVQD